MKLLYLLGQTRSSPDFRYKIKALYYEKRFNPVKPTVQQLIKNSGILKSSEQLSTHLPIQRALGE